MCIRQTLYKNIPALEIKTRSFEALFLPSQGGKLASLRDRADGTQWMLERTGGVYRKLEYDGIYIESECSGFDDLFPTVDPYIPLTGAHAGAEYPDHGEICRLIFSAEASGGRITLRAKSRRFSYICTKTITESESGGLEIDYRIENRADGDMECLWAGHVMLAGCTGGKILIPYLRGADAVLMFGREKDTGGPGARFCLSDEYLMSEAFSSQGDTYKYYLAGSPERGCCGYYRPDAGRTLLMTYDVEKLPYLGVWINNGSFQGIYNIALEPCTAPFDRCDTAAAHGIPSLLPAGGTLEFTVCFDSKKGEGL